MAQSAGAAEYTALTSVLGILLKNLMMGFS